MACSSSVTRFSRICGSHSVSRIGNTCVGFIYRSAERVHVQSLGPCHRFTVYHCMLWAVMGREFYASTWSGFCLKCICRVEVAFVYAPEKKLQCSLFTPFLEVLGSCLTYSLSREVQGEDVMLHVDKSATHRKTYCVSTFPQRCLFEAETFCCLETIPTEDPTPTTPF